MKKRDDNKKVVTRIKSKKAKGSAVNKRAKRSEPDPWKEIRLKLKPLGKAYHKFLEKRKIAKQKEKQKRLKIEEEQKHKEEEAIRLHEQEERILKKKKKIKEEEEKRLKAQEEQRLEEKRIKEEREERIRQEQIYKERLIKGDQERTRQLERVSQLREEEKKLREERDLKIDSRFVKAPELEEQKLEEQRLEKQKLEEQRLKDEVEKNFKKKKRLNGTVKWYNVAKGYGFIKREGKEKDIFVHSSAVQNSGLKYLTEGEQITFEVEYADKGPSAINLQETVNEVSRSHLKVVK